MRNLTRFFFYYTFLSVNALVFVSFSFLDTPYNLIYTVVLAPTVLFFWLKITDPEGSTESSWSARLVIAIGVLSSLSILSFYLYQTKEGLVSELEQQLAQERTNSGLQVASISGELALLRSELLTREQDQDTDVLEASTSARNDQDSKEILDLLNALDQTNQNDKNSEDISTKDVIGKVSLLSSSPANVYKEGNLNAKIVGILEPELDYNYFEYNGSWYLVEISADRQGWVESGKVKVVN